MLRGTVLLSTALRLKNWVIVIGGDEPLGGEDEGEEVGGMSEVTHHIDPATFLPPGTRVEVRKRFDASWAHGFEVVGLGNDGYRLRRLSDGYELPADFNPEEVRREKSRNDLWWY